MAAEYEFRLAGHVEPGTLRGFDGMTVLPGVDETIIRGHLAGQPAVLATLARFHSLGLTLTEFRRTDPRRPGLPGGAGPPVDLPAGVALVFGIMGGAAGSAAAGVRQGRKAAESLLPAAALLRRLPGSESVSRALRARADELTRRGAADCTAGLGQVRRVWSAALSRIGDDPEVSRMVRRIADRAVGPVVDAALPLVLDRLAADPKHIRHILGVQSFGMTEEVTDAIRERTAAADDKVERFARRLVRRRRAAGTSPLSHEA